MVRKRPCTSPHAMAVNWPGLLAWSTKYHDGTAPSQFKQMTEEDRRFLEKAMEEAFGKIVDPNEVMREAINQVKAENRTDESIITALEIIDRCCDDPDCARNAEKLDGLQPMIDLLKTHSGSIRIRALEILALFFSNNPHIQEVGMRRGAMAAFLQLFKDCPAGSEERSKAFRSLVALVRQVQPYEETFLRKEDGVAIIVSCLSREEDPRTREKAASFVRSLAGDGRLLAEDVAPLAKAVAPLFEDIDQQNIQYRETMSSCALELVHAHPSQCPAELKAAVEARIPQLQGASEQDSEHELASLKECLAALAGTTRAGADAAA